MSCDEKLSGAEFYPGNLSQEVGLKDRHRMRVVKVDAETSFGDIVQSDRAADGFQ